MSAALQRATRNALTLRWWASCSLGFRLAAREGYARAYGIPLCELGNLDTFSQDEDVVAYLALAYANTLDAFAQDCATLS